MHNKKHQNISNLYVFLLTNELGQIQLDIIKNSLKMFVINNPKLTQYQKQKAIDEKIR